MNIKYLAPILLLVLTIFISSAQAKDKIEMQGILAVAKIAGACGILDEMIAFQTKTKMLGGDEFVTRLWQTEAARQGKTVEQLSNDCNRAISAYDKIWKASDSK
jgi:hypothetical protein